MILVTGTGSGATRYMSKLFCSFGLPVGHEERREGDVGVSCWTWGGRRSEVEAPPWSPGVRPPRGSFVMVHVTRDPMMFVASRSGEDAYQGSAEDRWIRKNIDMPGCNGPDGRLRYRALLWCRWHMHIRAQHPEVTLKAETAHVKLSWMFGRPPSEPTNRRDHTRGRNRGFSIGRVVDVLNADDLDEMREAADVFGYTLPF